jgi:serine protease Do
MKNKAHFLLLTVVVLMIAAPSVLAQPGPQPMVFYGEGPWGGSYLGVDTQNVSADRIGQLHLKEERGVEVTTVDQDAPAGKAGIKEHDVILSVNEQQVESVEQLRRIIREIPAGRTVTIGISRDGQPLTLKAQLTERKNIGDMDHVFNFNMPPITVPAVHIPPINMPDMDVPSVVIMHSPARSGLMVENLTPQLGDYFGVKSGTGVLVRSVEKGSRGEQAGFRAGDVVVKINGSPVNERFHTPAA